MCDGSDTRSGDHIIPGNHVGGDYHPSIPSAPTSNVGGDAEPQIIILNPLLAFGLVPEQRYAPPLNSFQDDLLQEFCSTRFGEEYICQLPPEPICTNCTNFKWIYWNSSLVPWDEVTFDVAGIVADLYPVLQGPVEAAEAYDAITLGIDLLGIAHDLNKTMPPSNRQLDEVDLTLDVLSLIPEIGIIPSGIGLLRNLIRGFEIR
jgi:hypothetical protein